MSEQEYQYSFEVNELRIRPEELSIRGYPTIYMNGYIVDGSGKYPCEITFSQLQMRYESHISEIYKATKGENSRVLEADCELEAMARLFDDLRRKGNQS